MYRYPVSDRSIYPLCIEDFMPIAIANYYGSELYFLTFSIYVTRRISLQSKRTIPYTT